MASASSIWKTFQDIHVRSRLPESVSITHLPENANVYIGENIDPDILVIPVEALVPLQFPLSSLFLDFFDYIKISPLQLAPIAYRILAYCEAISRPSVSISGSSSLQTGGRWSLLLPSSSL